MPTLPRLPETAGPLLEARIERRVFGARGSHPAPAYSRADDAADRLVREVERPDLRCAVSRFGADWYAIWWTDRSRPERVATGSGPSRPLAICRAVANLPEQCFAAATEGDPAAGLSPCAADGGGARTAS